MGRLLFIIAVFVFRVSYGEDAPAGIVALKDLSPEQKGAILASCTKLLSEDISPIDETPDNLLTACLTQLNSKQPNLRFTVDGKPEFLLPALAAGRC